MHATEISDAISQLLLYDVAIINVTLPSNSLNKTTQEDFQFNNSSDYVFVLAFEAGKLKYRKCSSYLKQYRDFVASFSSVFIYFW